MSDDRSFELKPIPKNIKKLRFSNPILFTLIAFSAGTIAILFADRYGNKSKIDTYNNSHLENTYAALMTLVGVIAANIIFAVTNLFYEKCVNHRDARKYLGKLVPCMLVVFYLFAVSTQLTSSTSKHFKMNAVIEKSVDTLSFVGLAGFATLVIAICTKLFKIPVPKPELAQYFATMASYSVLGGEIAPLITSNPWIINTVGSAATLVSTSMMGWMGTAPCTQGPNEITPLLEVEPPQRTVHFREV